MPKDEILSGQPEELLEFEFEPLHPATACSKGIKAQDDEIIELINPIKRGEVPQDILNAEIPLSVGKEKPVFDAPAKELDLSDLDKDLEEIFSEKPAPKPPLGTPEPAVFLEDEPIKQGDGLVGRAEKPVLVQEHLEAVIEKAVTETVERVARQAIEAAAERAIREAIDALRESLKVPRM